MDHAHNADGVKVQAARDLPEGEYRCLDCTLLLTVVRLGERRPHFRHRKGRCPGKPASAPPVEPLIESTPVAGRPPRVDPTRPAPRGLLRRLVARVKDTIAWWRGRSDTESAA